MSHLNYEKVFGRTQQNTSNNECEAPLSEFLFSTDLFCFIF